MKEELHDVGYLPATEDRLLTAKLRWNVIFIYGLSAVTGMRAVFEPVGWEPLFCSLLMGVLMTRFCMMDSHVRGKPLAWSVPWLIFFTWPIFVPVYLVATRGLKRFHWVLLAMGGYFVAMLIPYLIMDLVVLGQEW